MRYVTLEARKLSIGSGQVESAVRRVINLRFKAPGSLELFPNKGSGRLSSQKAMEGANRWVSKSETIVR